MPFIAAVDAYMTATGVFTLCNHLEPTAAVGSNCHIWLVEATLMLNPPIMYSLLPFTAKPPGRIVPAASHGQSSAHEIELPISREINADRAHGRTEQVGTSRPNRCGAGGSGCRCWRRCSAWGLGENHLQTVGQGAGRVALKLSEFAARALLDAN